MKIPCEECLLIPICKHKMFFQLIYECKIIKEFDMENSDKHPELISELEDVLKPTVWSWKK